ncbi:ATP-binding protein [Bosea sp. AAP35]|uniref:ATP-binding protein n=1 Tax=Bosea sp. AAP35 TaxID=1523417 RepID=UPI0012E30FA4|nr:ATP-binding protein [Bosea sp. AAP35]
MNSSQLELDLVIPEVRVNVALLSPREIWLRLDARMISDLVEDRRVEFKRPQIELKDLAPYFSMWSNTPEGGILIIGCKSDGSPVGCSSVGQRKMNEIERLHLVYCPLAKHEYRRIECIGDLPSDYILAIYVPYAGRLVETNKNQAFIRYGDSIHEMSDEERRDFRNATREPPFELEEAHISYPLGFNMAIVRKFCQNYRDDEGLDHLSDEEILELRNLGRRDEGRFIPNKALAILAGNNPRSLIPGCRVRVQRFSGRAEGEGETYRPLFDRFIEGNIVEIIEESRSIINTLVHDITWMNDEGKFITTKEYPVDAWFEALVNACVHRSYSFSGAEVTIKLFEDRLEVESPGGFYPPVTEKNIYEVRAARNHHLMDALRSLGYVRMAREGTRRMRESMRRWALPEPAFRQQSIHGVVVRVLLQNNIELRKRETDRDFVNFFGGDLWLELPEHERKIASFALRNTNINVSDAQRITGRTWKTSKKDLERLVEKKVLIFVPGMYERDPQAHYSVRPSEF